MRLRPFHLLLLCAWLTSCAAPPPPTPAPTQAVAPPGVKFTRFSPPGGEYQLDVPEGWVVQQKKDAVQMVEGASGLRIEFVTPVRSENEAVLLVMLDKRRVQVSQVQTVTLPAGPAFAVDSTIDSIPDPKTKKTHRLQENNWFVTRANRTARIKLWTPIEGTTDTAEATWGHIVSSFRWR